MDCSVEEVGDEADRVDAAETARKRDFGHGRGDRAGDRLVGDGGRGDLDAVLEAHDANGAGAGNVAQHASHVDGLQSKGAVGSWVYAGDVGVGVAEAVQVAVGQHVGVGLRLDGLKILTLVENLGKSCL